MRWQWPRVRARPALALLAAFLFVGTLQGFLVRYYQSLHGVTDRPVVLFQLTGAVTAWAALPIVQFVVLNAKWIAWLPGAGPAARLSWSRLIALHFAGYLSFSLVHVFLLRTLRWLLVVSSVVSVADGDLASRVLWEMQNDVIVYASAAGLLTVLQAWRERDDSAIKSAALEARLAEARLSALSAQVDPHFFYNALNTISAVMYEDLAKTERLLDSLGRLMRATLRDNGAGWTVDEERAHVERYLDLLLARFGDRLSVQISQQPGTGGALVPRFAIQTLLENAVKHNASRPDALHVWLDVRRSGERIEVIVEDDGAGFATRAVPEGRGLARLGQTLDLLHGRAAGLERGNGLRGGASVRFWLPVAA